MKIKLDDGAIMPTRAHSTDAGLDLYSREEKTIYPMRAAWDTSLSDMVGFIPQLAGGETFDTGVHMEFPHGCFGKIESKSGLNTKASVVSCGGVIDEGYTGSIVVKLYNLGSKPYTVHKGDKIAQLVILLYATPDMELVDALEATERGDNGFGSTGR